MSLKGISNFPSLEQNFSKAKSNQIIIKFLIHLKDKIFEKFKTNKISHPGIFVSNILRRKRNLILSK